MILAAIVAIAAIAMPLIQTYAQTVIVSQSYVVIPRQGVTYGNLDVTQYSLPQLIEICGYDDYCKKLYGGGPYYSDR